MNLDDLRTALAAATQMQLHALEESHWRYMTLIGSVNGVVPTGVAAADRTAYPQYAKKPGSRTSFSEEDCITFMMHITGLSSAMCAAWADPDFYLINSAYL
ncbi:TPA: hypothetical protein ACG5DM_004297 [Pseudomonas putida]|uniref:hypothetical protein n=1 Tax=Pseudomonas TaxID=286 RepID=UPI000C7BC98B|nr:MULTISPECIES: hypothetical protein [Pseudomonas]MCT8162661.1 hypothetical protein [Pseudomonas sp. HD6422]MCT8181570.1 hypothetical protein [Pseudomonas sp. HD6421]PLP85805.1 hypothetical protein CX682_29620 [Pseudomonas sp. FFUP_PS_41]QDQ70641.1 hypothetical protein pJBCL41_00423 [Pseudomonas sp.]WVM70369.1 hypothetical protein V1687_28890 [Pseudomonas putida]